MPPVRLLIENIPRAIGEEELSDLFAPACELLSVSFQTGRPAGRRGGKAVVEVATEAEARRLRLGFDGYVLERRQLNVQRLGEGEEAGVVGVPGPAWAPPQQLPKPGKTRGAARRPHRPERSPGR